MSKRLQNMAENAIKLARPEGAGNADEPLEHKHLTGGDDMSRYGQYGDSTPEINQNICERAGLL